MSHADEITRAEQAKRILTDELFQASFDEVETAIIGQWCDLGVENKAQAEELKRLLWAAKQFRAVFESTIAGAQVAKNELLSAESMQIKREAALERVRNYA